MKNKLWLIIGIAIALVLEVILFVYAYIKHLELQQFIADGTTSMGGAMSILGFPPGFLWIVIVLVVGFGIGAGIGLLISKISNQPKIEEPQNNPNNSSKNNF